MRRYLLIVMWCLLAVVTPSVWMLTRGLSPSWWTFASVGIVVGWIYPARHQHKWQPVGAEHYEHGAGGKRVTLVRYRCDCDRLKAEQVDGMWSLAEIIGAAGEAERILREA